MPMVMTFAEEDWPEVYASLGADRSKRVLYQNTGEGTIWLWIGDTKPTEKEVGFHLKSGDYFMVFQNTSDHVYALGNQIQLTALIMTP